MSIRPNAQEYSHRISVAKELLLLSEHPDAVVENIADLQNLQQEYLVKQNRYIDFLEQTIALGAVVTVVSATAYKFLKR